MEAFLSATDFNFKGKTALVRIDTDVDLRQEEGKLVVDEDFRLRSAIPTIKFLLEKGVGKIILLGHLGRPEGRVVSELSLEPVAQKFKEFLNLKIKNKKLKIQIKNQKFGFFSLDDRLLLLENLRFFKGEEENDREFARELASLGDVFVNEAFGVSHREHASIVGIPRFLPSFLGLKFEGEIRVLDWLKRSAKRPLVFVLGGSKSDKLGYIDFLSQWCDKLLIGGKLPLKFKVQSLDFARDKSSKARPELVEGFKIKVQNSKLILGELMENDRDINEATVERFIREIKEAKTIVWLGPLGVYEEKENQKGTFEIAKAIAESRAFKVAGGGDTHRVLSLLNLWEKFDFVSIGGGATLRYLAEGSLPGIGIINEIKSL